MQLTVPNTFANGTGEANIIDAVKMNANFAAVVTVLNGNIEKDNVKTGSAIALLDTNQSITGVWTFSENPVFNAGGIDDAALSDNIPRKDTLGDWTGKQGFLGGINMERAPIENVVVHKSMTPPATPVSGQIYYDLAEGKFMGYDGSAWKQLDYTGAYTGGAVRSYAGNGIADDGDQFQFPFKTEGAAPTVKIWFKGLPFPKRYYTELGYHTHDFTGVAHTHVLTDSGHTHNVVMGYHYHTGNFATATHTHSIGITSGGISASHYHTVPAGNAAHTHGQVMPGTDSSASALGFPFNTGNESTGHTHYVSGTSSGPSAYTTVDNADLGTKVAASAVTGISVAVNTATGSNAAAGVNAGTLSVTQKLYGKNLTVKIDGENVTADVLTATGWAAIGDGTDSHDLHATGSGELNASAWVTYAAGYHILEIIEPEAGYGLGLMVHIETA